MPRKRVNLSLSDAELKKVDRMLKRTPWKYQRRTDALKCLVLYLCENDIQIGPLVTQRNPEEPRGTQRNPEEPRGTDGLPNSAGTEIALKREEKKEEQKKKEKNGAPRLAPLPVSEDVIGYLNSKAGTNFDYSADGHRKLIQARLNDGRTVDDLKTVIDKMTAQWLNTKMQGNLRPSTLFRASNFENYIGQREAAPERRAPRQRGFADLPAPDDPIWKKGTR